MTPHDPDIACTFPPWNFSSKNLRGTISVRGVGSCSISNKHETPEEPRFMAISMVGGNGNGTEPICTPRALPVSRLCGLATLVLGQCRVATTANGWGSQTRTVHQADVATAVYQVCCAPTGVAVFYDVSRIKSGTEDNAYSTVPSGVRLAGRMSAWEEGFLRSAPDSLCFANRRLIWWL